MGAEREPQAAQSTLWPSRSGPADLGEPAQPCLTAGPPPCLLVWEPVSNDYMPVCRARRSEVTLLSFCWHKLLGNLTSDHIKPLRNKCKWNVLEHFIPKWEIPRCLLHSASEEHARKWINMWSLSVLIPTIPIESISLGSILDFVVFKLPFFLSLSLSLSHTHTNMHACLDIEVEWIIKGEKSR